MATKADSATVDNLKRAFAAKHGYETHLSNAEIATLWDTMDVEPTSEEQDNAALELMYQAEMI